MNEHIVSSRYSRDSFNSSVPKVYDDVRFQITCRRHGNSKLYNGGCTSRKDADSYKNKKRKIPSQQEIADIVRYKIRQKLTDKQTGMTV